jgi:hypothetical protein
VGSAALPASPEVAPAPAALGEAPPADHHLVEHRLAALERLSHLVERGMLTREEFAAEKALVLRLPADELLLREQAEVPPPPPSPSLAGRLFGWPLLLGGAGAGLALSAYTMPQEAAQLLRMLS